MTRLDLSGVEKLLCSIAPALTKYPGDREQRWNHLGMHIRLDDFTDQEAMATIVRITGSNFCVIYRLLVQVERISEMNKLRTVTKEVVVMA
jgi:hypothetical protein